MMRWISLAATVIAALFVGGAVSRLPEFCRAGCSQGYTVGYLVPSEAGLKITNPLQLNGAAVFNGEIVLKRH